jgi:Dolichyl-phosphate-mannose-protein mannosyltransferase
MLCGIRTGRVVRPALRRRPLAEIGADYFGMSGRHEFVLATSWIIAFVLLSFVNVFYRKFNSDEVQHLHVLWSWTRGSVQYRDIFDNHMPLFHLAFAPICGLIGPRASIIYWMRLLVLPLSFVSVWCTYRIGARLSSRRAGVWTAIALGFFSVYNGFVLQFRPDNLVTPLWLLCLLTLLEDEITVRRALVAGLLLGFCFAVSIKSTVFLLSCTTGFALAMTVVHRQITPNSLRHLARCGTMFLAATALVPGTIALFFASKGAWPQFRYCVFDFNFLAGDLYQKQLLYRAHPELAFTILAAGIAASVYIASILLCYSPERNTASRRVFVLFLCLTYLIILKIFWPPLSRTYAGLYPLVFVLFMGGVLGISQRLTKSNPRLNSAISSAPTLIVIAELIISFATHPIREKATSEEINLLRNVLALTDPSDVVLDCKGETVFRARCYRPVLERITMRAIRNGVFPDDIPEYCIKTHDCVVATIFRKRFPPGTRDFVRQNYLPVAKDLRVAGTTLHRSTQDPHQLTFNVVIPADYEIISPDGEGDVAGTLDGKVYAGPRSLSAGPHVFEQTSPASNRLILLWARAAERHYLPLTTRDS